MVLATKYKKAQRNWRSKAAGVGRMAMATYILLVNFTEQGVRNAKDTARRADAFKEMAKKSGANVKELYWTLGQYDAVTILEAPDDMTATALALSLGKLGNVRTQTLPAFSAAEMKTIIGKMT
jgi:uncharacterized protein with GYD domain